MAHVGASRLPLLCAGTAFFAVLSIAPVLVTALSVYGAVMTPTEASAQLTRVSETLPSEMESLVDDQLRSITTASADVLTVRGLVGLLLALWTATTAMSSLIDALGIAYHQEETRSFLRRTGLALGLVLGGALLLAVVLALARAGTHLVGSGPEVVRDAAPVLAWAALGILMALVLAFLYRVGPDRRAARWRWISWGAAGATLLWVATSVALFAYVRTLGTYESTYGSLAGVAISMLWVWFSVLLVVLGAAVNGEAERQTLRDSTVGPERPRGQRGAVVADSTPYDEAHDPTH